MKVFSIIKLNQILGSRDQKEYSRHKRHKRPSKDLKKNLETKTLKEATKMTHPKNYASHAAYKISVSLNLFYFIIINYSQHSEKGHLDIATDHFDFALKKVEKDVARKVLLYNKQNFCFGF